MKKRIVRWARRAGFPSEYSKSHIEKEAGLTECGCTIPEWAEVESNPDPEQDCRKCINTVLRSKGMMTHKERVERTADRRVGEFLEEDKCLK